MSQSRNILVLPSDYAPEITLQEVIQHMQLQNQLLESYVNRASGQSDQEWLKAALAKHSPDTPASEIESGSSDILNTLNSLHEKTQRNQKYMANGLTETDLLTDDLVDLTKDMTSEQAADFTNQLSRQVYANNKKLKNVYDVYSSLSPETLAQNNSAQYAALSMVERFNKQAQQENSGLHAVLAEDDCSELDPYGKIKIFNASNELVDSLSIHYVNEPSKTQVKAADQAFWQDALQKISDDLSIDDAQQPIGININLPNGQQQGVYVDLPSYGQTRFDASGRVYDNVAERSPLGSYFVFPDETTNLPVGPWQQQQISDSTMLLILGSKMARPTDAIYERMSSIAMAIRHSALFSIDYSKYWDIAAKVAKKSFEVSKPVAKYVAKNLVKGTVFGLQLVGSVAIKVGNFTWEYLKEVDYKQAAIMAFHGVSTCAKAVFSVLRAACKLGVKAVKGVVEMVKYHQSGGFASNFTSAKSSEPLWQELHDYNIEVDVSNFADNSAYGATGGGGGSKATASSSTVSGSVIVEGVAALAQAGLTCALGPVAGPIAGAVAYAGTKVLGTYTHNKISEQSQQQSQELQNQSRHQERSNRLAQGRSNTVKTKLKHKHKNKNKQKQHSFNYA